MNPDFEDRLQVFETPNGNSFNYILDDDNNLFFNAESVAYELGFFSVTKNGVCQINWKRINQLLQNFGYVGKVNRDSYIPENFVYRLAMKADNDLAKKFQDWLANVVIVSVRKTGGYDIRRNPKFQRVRKLSIDNRKAAASSICNYADYAISRGDWRSKTGIIGQLTNKANAVAGIPKGGRPTASVEQLAVVIMADGIEREETSAGIALKKSPSHVESKIDAKLRQLRDLLPKNFTNLLR